MPLRCTGASTTSQALLWGLPPPGIPTHDTLHLHTRGCPGSAGVGVACTSTTTQREEVYACPKSSTSPVMLGWYEVALPTADHCPASPPSPAPGMPDGTGRSGSAALLPGPGGSARRSRASRQGEHPADLLQRSAGSSCSWERARPWLGPGGSIPHSTSVSGKETEGGCGCGIPHPGCYGGHVSGTYPGDGR